MNYPLFNPDWIRYNSKVGSEEYTENMKRTIRELVELSKNNEHMKERLLELYDLIVLENEFLKSEVIKLETEINSLGEIMENLESAMTSGAIIDEIYLKNFSHYFEMINENSKINNTEAGSQLFCEVNEDYEEVGLPKIRKESKIYFINDETDEIELKKDFNIESLVIQSGSISYENNIINCVDGKKESAWIKKVEYDITNVVNKCDILVEVNLPGDKLNNIKFNNIQLSLVGETEWEKIEFFNGEEWEEINGIDSYKLRKNKKGNQSFNFEMIESTKIRILICSKKKKIINSNQVFEMGIRSIEVNEIEFFEEAVIWIPFEMQGIYSAQRIDYDIKNKSSLELTDWNYEKQIEEIFEERYFVKDGSGMKELDESEIDDEISYRDFYVRLNLRKNYKGVAPFIERATLVYTRG
jgi:hypothetical protein